MVLTTLVNGVRETRELTEGTYFIGRGESCAIRFNSPDVSERHAIMTVRDGMCWLEDLHSANGTYVNGEAVDGRVQLDASVVVQIGENMFRVSEAEEEPEEEKLKDEVKSKKGRHRLLEMTIPLFNFNSSLQLKQTRCARSARTCRSRSSASF